MRLLRALKILMSQKSERKTRQVPSHLNRALEIKQQFYHFLLECQRVSFSRLNSNLEINSSFYLFCHVPGGLSHSPTGQAAGLAVASALVTLGNPRRPSIDLNPKDTNKSKRKQSQHPDNL